MRKNVRPSARDRQATRRLIAARGMAHCEALEERRLLATFVVDSLDTVDDGNRAPGNFALIEAIADANATPEPDDIVISESLVGQTLNIPAEFDITRPTTFRGPTTGTFTISGQDAVRIFDISDGNSGDIAVLIRDLILTNGNSGTEVGGAIRSAEDLTLENVTIRNSTGALGGGVYLSGGSLTANATTRIENNTATTAGGGIYANNNTAVTLTGTVVTGNTADGAGGGIAADSNTTVSLTNAQIRNNTVPNGSGGGVYSTNGTSLSITSSVFSGNTASSNGGGGFASGVDSVTVSNSTFSENNADNNGGGALFSIAGGGTMSISGSTFDMNTAGNSGGGLDLAMSTTGTLTLDMVTLTGNSATGSGGGLRIVTAGGQATVSNSTFTSNSAVVDGGAIETLAQSLSIVDSGFEMNSATQGGAIAFTSAGTNTLAVSGSTISQNTAASNGGGVYVRKPFATSTSEPVFRLADSTVTSNTATGGAGVYISGDENTGVEVLDSTISSNTASSIGGGLMLTGINDETSFTLTLTNSTIDGNRANTLDGGGIFSTAGTVTINNSTITNNTAARDGGGLHDAGRATIITDTSISGNTAAVRGGGYYKARSGTSTRFDNSLVSGNTSTSSDGGGIQFRGSSLFVSNSTVSGNTGSFGAGIRIDQTSTVTINNSTITANTARGQLGGLGVSSASVDLFSSIVAGNTDADNTDPDVDASFLGTNTNNLINTDPMLSDLADFGGPTLTHMPMQGSPALDAGSNTFGLTTDARGFARDDGNSVDIGATEAFRPIVTVDAQSVTITDRAVVINIDTATDADGSVTGIQVYRDVNNNGTPDDGELIDTITLGGTVSLPVEQLPVGTSNLLFVPEDNTGLLGAPSTGSVTLTEVPGFSTVEVVDSSNAATTTLERGRSYTINVAAPVNGDAAGSIVGFDIYNDLNGNGQGDANEFIGFGAYSESEGGTGSVMLTRTQTAESLVEGTNTLLIVPLTSRQAAESIGNASTVMVTVTAARTANETTEVAATAASDLHRVVGISADGSPLLFEQASNGTWTITQLDDATGIDGEFADETEIWTNATGLTRVAVLTNSSVIIFSEQADGSFVATDLGTQVPGGTAISTSMTSFTTADGRVYLAGYTADNQLVTYFQPTADSATWAFDNISDDLTSGGFTTPVLTDLTSYVTAWNQWSIVGLDTNGDIQNVWVLPGTFEVWRLDNLSDITGAPELSSGLSPILTSWSGINLTALDSSGNLRVTWWVPSFGGDWVSSDLSAIAQNSGEVDDRVIVEVMTGYITSWSGMNYAGVNAEGDLIIYWWVPAFGGDWLVSQITDGGSVTGYDPTADVSSFVSPEGTLNVVGSGPQGDVLRSSWRPGDAAWSTEVLSTIAEFI